MKTPPSRNWNNKNILIQDSNDMEMHYGEQHDAFINN